MSPDKLKKRKVKDRSKVDKEITKELNTQEKRKKSGLDLKKKRKRDVENIVGSVAADPPLPKDCYIAAATNHDDFNGERKILEKNKKKKSKLGWKKKKKKKKNRENANEVVSDNDDLVYGEEDADDGMMHQKGKKEKKHKNEETHISMGRKKEAPGGVDEPKLDEISSVDEDCSRGMKSTGLKQWDLTVNMKIEGIDLTEGTYKATTKVQKRLLGQRQFIKCIDLGRIIRNYLQLSPLSEMTVLIELQLLVTIKWLLKYKESRPGLNILQQRIDAYITAYEEQQEQEKEEREARAAEGGWTVVVHHKGRKKTTDTESGVTVGSVAQAAVVDKMGKKKSKEIPLDFYRFQKREAQRNEVMMLQSKFEQDKKRIQQLRAARKFRPY